MGSGSHGQQVRMQGVHPPFLQAPYLRLASTRGLLSGYFLPLHKNFKLNAITILCLSESYNLEDIQMSFTLVVTTSRYHVIPWKTSGQLRVSLLPPPLVTTGLALI